MDKNIKLNQLIDTIADDIMVRIIRYENDRILMEGKVSRLSVSLKRADFDVLGIDLADENVMEITIKMD